VISGFTQFAIGRLGKDHPVSADLKQVTDAANSAASLTHQLLAFSRKQVMQPRALELDAVVQGMEGMLRRLIGAHITLEVSGDGQHSRVKADPGQIEQVLLNLAVNARDAMPDGGTLHISTEQRTSRAGSREVVLRVRDTGTGMTQEVRDRIFEPFFTTKDVGKGTGLGLSTVYGIVVQSGGTIEVESAPGQGTTFTVVLQPIAEAVLDQDDEQDDNQLSLGTETILLVDDEEAVLTLARRTLESCGYRVIHAHSGVEALTLARSERVDLIVTDVVMPQLSGPQLVERYLAKDPEPKIVYMTGYVDDETMRLELDEDVVLLRKPFGPADLARTVRAVLDARPSMVPSP
jgi:CheY-like chemotaxis protein